MFNHFLITRFNLSNPQWNVTKNNEALLTDDWMENRMWLFENFCFPSVANQTNKNFSWLLYFDASTKEAFKNRIEQLTHQYENIKVFYIDGMPAFYDEVKAYITQKADEKYLITSRIDNDDCIHRSFIDEVQKKFNSQDYLAVDVVKGYSLQVEPIYRLGKKEHIFNPFISLIEKNQMPKTVWFNDHNLWKKERNITQIKDKRLWLSIIHKKNKVNQFDGYANINWSTLERDFIISKDIAREIQNKLIPEKDWLYVSLRNFIHVNFVRYFKTLKRKMGIYRLK